MVTYDVALFKNLLSRLQTLIQTNVTFFDEKIVETEVYTGPQNPVCDLIKRHLRNACEQTDANALSTCRTNADHAYRCHFGMTEMLFKMTSGNETYGYIMIGPFRDPANEATCLRNIRDFCQKHGEDEATMRQSYYATATFSEEKAEAIQTIVHAIFDHALQRHIVSMRHTELETNLVSYVNDHLQESITMQSLCNRFYISQKQLYAIFKRATGVSPKRYVLQQRIEQAQKWITTTNLPIQQIAYRVGMSDYSYFGKLFKSATGYTPNGYRKKFSARTRK